MTLVTRDTRLICGETKEYPLFLDDVRKREGALIGISTDSANIEALGYFPVEETPKPTEGNVISEAAPAYDEESGKWSRVWDVRQYNPAEYSAYLQQTKDTMQYKVDQWRNEQFAIGFPHLFPDGEVYHAQVNTVGRGNISDLRTLAKEAIADGTPFQVVFRVYENVNCTLTAEETVELGNAAAMQVQAGYARTWALKDAIRDATTLEEIPDIPESLFTL